MTKRSMTGDEVRKRLTKAVGGSHVLWAYENNMSYAHLMDVLTGRREPGRKILDALGLEPCEKRYRAKAVAA